jgi:O-antigen ligase
MSVSALPPRNARDVLPAVSLVVVALLWTLPFLQPRHAYPVPLFYSEWLAFALGLAALLPLASRASWTPARFPVIALAPLALAGVVLVQAALGHVPYAGQAMMAGYYLVWCAALIVLGAELARRIDLTTIAAVLAAALVVSGIVSSVVGLLQYYDLAASFEPWIMPPLGSVYGNLAQHNHYGDYLALAIASCAYLYASGRVRGGIAAAASAVLILGLGASTSRSIWLYLLVTLVLALVHRARSPGPVSLRLALFAGLMVAGFALDQWLMSVAFVSTGAATATQRVFTENGAVKLQHLGVAWWMFTHAPLIGIGWGGHAWFDFEYKSLFDVPVRLGVTTNAHNVITQLLAETGLAGAVPVLAAALLYLYDAWRAPSNLERWWLIALLAILATHSMLEFPLWHSYFLGIAAISLGLGTSRFLAVKARRMAPVACAALIVMGIANAVSIARAYRGFEGLFAASSEKSDPAVLSALVRLAEGDEVLRPYIEQTLVSRMPIDDRDLDAKLALNARVLHFFPSEMTVFRHAALLALNGDRSGAVALFNQGARAYPEALPGVRIVFLRLAHAYPAQIAPLLELATAKSPPPPVAVR